MVRVLDCDLFVDYMCCGFWGKYLMVLFIEVLVYNICRYVDCILY